MRKVWLVLKREYITRVISKGFLLSTIAIPALFGGMIAFEASLNHTRPPRPFKIALLDESGAAARAVSEDLSRVKLSGGAPEFDIEEVDPGSSPGKVRSRLEALVRDRSLDGYLWLPSGHDQTPELIEGNEALLQSAGDVNRALTNATIAARLKGYGVDPNQLKALLAPVSVRVTRLTGKGRQEDKGQGYLLAFVMATILYGALVMYGIITMRSVLEEKTTRTMEVLISSASPGQLMMGKILGVGAVGLTQFLIWAFSAGAIAAYGAAAARFSGGLRSLSFSLPAATLVCFVIYFLGGYFLFASLYAAIGAAVSDPNDAQQLQMPVTLILVASFLLFRVVARDPSSTTSIILTLVPFFSPILMTFRIALQTPPFWQIALSITILWLTTAGIVYAAARIYRVGVLMYGKRPSLAEVARWMRYS